MKTTPRVCGISFPWSFDRAAGGETSTALQEALEDKRSSQDSAQQSKHSAQEYNLDVGDDRRRG